MASTSTGYPKSMIAREQPTSSGQIMSVSSGCQIHLTGDAQIKLSTGSVLIDENLYEASSAMSITNRRTELLYLASTKNAIYTLSNRPYKGDELTMVAETTFTHTVRFSTDKSVRLGATDSTCYGITLSPKAASAVFGVGAILRGLSSNQWMLVNASTVLIAGSTACT